MKKGKFKGLFQIVMCFACLMLMASGCGKKDKGEKEEKEFAYVAEYAQLDVKCEHIAQTVAAGDVL